MIVLNAGFAFVQERAGRARHRGAARAPAAARARPARRRAGRDRRDRRSCPGDVLLLAEGDRLSADARLVDGAVEVDMSPLTGESQPVTRSADALAAGAPSPLEAEDLVFAGTLCTGGEAQAVVYGTGMAHAARPHRRAVAARASTRPQPAAASGQPRRAADRGGRGRRWAWRSSSIGHLLAGLPLADAVRLRDRAARGQRPRGAAADDHPRAGRRRAADGASAARSSSG